MPAKPGAKGRCVSVILPNLFSDFMADKESVSPFYQQVKPEADAWSSWISKWANPSLPPSKVITDTIVVGHLGP